MNNRIVVDLNKVQYAYLNWVSNTGLMRKNKPKKPTVNGVIVGDELAGSAIVGFEGETMLQRATRRKLLDTWQPVLTVQLTANHSLTYTDEKAKSIWKEWCRRQFKTRNNLCK